MKTITREWIAVCKKDRPSGLSGDTGVERWSVGKKPINPMLPGTTIAITMYGNEGHANARLIAAAPDLLKAAKLALEKGENIMGEKVSYLSECIEKKLKAAIAKAEGK